MPRTIDGTRRPPEAANDNETAAERRERRERLAAALAADAACQIYS